MSDIQQIQQEQHQALAQRISEQNHLYQIRCGDQYRCMWCGCESPAITWVPMDKCPLCGGVYDAELLQSVED